MKGKKQSKTRMVWAVAFVVALTMVGCAAYASFFDDFSDVSSFSNWNGWGGPGYQSISGGQVTMTPPDIDGGMWVTSNQTFLYGTYEVKLRFDNTPWNWSYFGFFSRSPWANPIACMRTDVNLMLAAGDGGPGSNWDALNPNSPVLAPNVWHTIKMIWKPGSIETIYDGSSLGTYTTHVPSTALPVVLDVGRGHYSSAPAVFEVDHVKVDPIPEPSALASLAAMSGMLGILIRRRTR